MRERARELGKLVRRITFQFVSDDPVIKKFFRISLIARSFPTEAAYKKACS